MINIILQYIMPYYIHSVALNIEDHLNCREYMRYDYDIMNSNNDTVAPLHRYYWTYKLK